jgi:alpha-tubulin suppressor-like RCC1 family protein|tara:strand:+ start:968 stop:1246 length:279 start_codon:yes stop_codon:yes gene_type:complete
MAILLKVDSKDLELKVFPEDKKTFSLKEMYKYTNSTIVEFIYFENHIMIIDEEGKLNDKPLNELATYYFRKNKKVHDIIVGDALICELSEIK